jgi:hypothetical protein
MISGVENQIQFSNKPTSFCCRLEHVLCGDLQLPRRPRAVVDFNTVVVQPSINAIQEMKVQTGVGSSYVLRARV